VGSWSRRQVLASVGRTDGWHGMACGQVVAPLRISSQPDTGDVLSGTSSARDCLVACLPFHVDSSWIECRMRTLLSRRASCVRRLSRLRFDALDGRLTSTARESRVENPGSSSCPMPAGCPPGRRKVRWNALWSTTATAPLQRIYSDRPLSHPLSLPPAPLSPRAATPRFSAPPATARPRRSKQASTLQLVRAVTTDVSPVSCALQVRSSVPDAGHLGEDPD
jgi:hypothetical protein